MIVPPAVSAGVEARRTLTDEAAVLDVVVPLRHENQRRNGVLTDGERRGHRGRLMRSPVDRGWKTAMLTGKT